MEDKKKEMAPKQKPEEEKEKVRDLPDEQLKGVAGGGVPTIEPYRR